MSSTRWVCGECFKRLGRPEFKTIGGINILRVCWECEQPFRQSDGHLLSASLECEGIPTGTRVYLKQSRRRLIFGTVAAGPIEARDAEQGRTMLVVWDVWTNRPDVPTLAPMRHEDVGVAL